MGIGLRAGGVIWVWLSLIGCTPTGGGGGAEAFEADADPRPMDAFVRDAASDAAGLGAGAEVVDWVAIPEGALVLGTDDGEPNEGPARLVEVPAFELSRSEITVGQYLACVEAGACPPPTGAAPCTAARPRNNWNLQLPLNCVSLDKMHAFAAWVGGRLPSEAEWEFAARSGQPQPWPWGAAPAECRTHGIMCGADHPRQVCQATEGFSAHGVCDLVGNLSEMVGDRYLDDLGQAPVDGSAYIGPAQVGVAGAEHWHAYRGGNYFSGLEYQRVTLRGPTDPENETRAIGFRVAR